MDLSIVIATKDRKRLIMQQLSALEPVMDVCEIVVVDDSSDGSLEAMNQKYGTRITSLKGTGDGAIGATNLGLLASRGKKALLLGDDLLIVGSPVDFVSRLMKDFDKAPMVGVHILSPYVESRFVRNLAWRVFSQTFPYTGFDSGYQDWVSIFAVDRERVPLLFDESYRGNGFNGESDFQLRARRMGARLWYDPRLIVAQAEEGDLRRSKDGERDRRAKGHEHFLQKNFPRTWFIRQAMFRSYLILADV